MPRLGSAERREAILAALERNNINRAAIEYDVTRQSLHSLVREATRNPEEAVREAKEELEFRRRVLELVG